MLLKDYESYIKCQEHVNAVYSVRDSVNQENVCDFCLTRFQNDFPYVLSALNCLVFVFYHGWPTGKV